jgi:hypothetical protein
LREGIPNDGGSSGEPSFTTSCSLNERNNKIETGLRTEGTRGRVERQQRRDALRKEMKSKYKKKPFQVSLASPNRLQMHCINVSLYWLSISKKLLPNFFRF